MNIPSFFNRIIKDVKNNVKNDFTSEQLSEAHLDKLATLWEHKLLAMDSVKPKQNIEYGKSPAEREGTVQNNINYQASTENNKTCDGSYLKLLDDTSESEDHLNGDVDDLKDNIPNLILAQFDKVTRSKSKWKCVMKDGVMNLNGKDYIFNKASGEFQW